MCIPAMCRGLRCVLLKLEQRSISAKITFNKSPLYDCMLVMCLNLAGCSLLMKTICDNMSVVSLVICVTGFSTDAV